MLAQKSQKVLLVLTVLVVQNHFCPKPPACFLQVFTEEFPFSLVEEHSEQNF